MKLLVTGSRGFIGQNLCKKLRSLNYSFDTFDIEDNAKARPKDLDISNYDWVFHLGAISSTTETDINKLMNLNLLWTVELFEECKKYSCNLQWSSSASVYGRRNKHQGSFKEIDVCKPSNYYAMSKYLAEQYIEKSSYDITVQGFRYFNVYGPYEEHKGNQASPYTQFTKQAIETGIIKVFEGSQDIYRDFVSVDTVVDAHIDMLRINSSGVFNLGSGKAKSFLDVANSVAVKYNAKVETIPFPKHLKQHYQYYTEADMSLLKNTIKHDI